MCNSWLIHREIAKIAREQHAFIMSYDGDMFIMEESGFDWDKPFIDWSDVEPVYDWFKECLTQ